ncbi:MAG: phosphatidate cytidylyltransferase [Acidiferrobacterales bacterium]
MSKSRPPGKLRRRALTALVLLPLVVAATTFLPSAWLAVFLGVFVVVAAWEWTILAGLNDIRWQVLYLLVLVGLEVLAIWVAWDDAEAALVLTTLALLWWVWAFIDLQRHGSKASGLFSSRLGKLVTGGLVLLPVWFAAVYLHHADPMKPAALLFAFSLVWLADTSAYFAGRQWGKTQLAPAVSPGKTIEGLIGALAAVTLLAYICGTMIWHLHGFKLVIWLFVALGTALFSVVGDLVESKLKRLSGAKDSGSWLPGHGGVLDRIDAVTAAVPVFACGWIMLVKGDA